MRVDVFDKDKQQEKAPGQGDQPQESVSLELVQPTAISEIERAQIDMQIATAKNFPRTISTSLDKAKVLACADPSIADDCTYAVKRGKDTITGPTIRLAEIMATSWGNLKYGARIIAIEDRRVVAQGVCHDLESNTSVSVEVSRSIVNRYGKRFSDDMIRTTSQAAIAIAIRNAVFKIIPGGYVALVQRAAQAVARKEVQGLVSRIEEAITAFASIGVPEVKVLAALNLTKREDITWNDIDKLLQFSASIKTGEATAAEIFGTTPDPTKSGNENTEGGPNTDEVEPGQEPNHKTTPTPQPGQQSFGKRAEREAAEKKAEETPAKALHDTPAPGNLDESGINLQF